MYPLSGLMDWDKRIPGGSQFIEAEIEKMKIEDNLFGDTIIGDVCELDHTFSSDSDSHSDFASLLLCRSATAEDSEPETIMKMLSDYVHRKCEYCKYNGGAKDIYVKGSTKVQAWEDLGKLIADIIDAKYQRLVHAMQGAYKEKNRTEFPKLREERDGWVQAAIAVGVHGEDVIKAVEHWDKKVFSGFV